MEITGKKMGSYLYLTKEQLEMDLGRSCQRKWLWFDLGRNLWTKNEKGQGNWESFLIHFHFLLCFFQDFS